MNTTNSSRKKAFYADPKSKPKTIPINLDGIPNGLRKLARWVPWVFVWKDRGKGGEWTKPPQSAITGKVADCTSPRNHGMLNQALRWVKSTTSDGIGFVLGDGFFGIDLDDCRNPETCELTPFAVKVLTLFVSYTEVSPSGTGIKIFGRGKLPAGCRNKNSAWPGNWAKNKGAGKLLRADLEAAGVPYVEDGLFADFHALRHSYISKLIRSGANLKVAQALARHSTITLTADRYGHLTDEEKRSAVAGFSMFGCIPDASTKDEDDEEPRNSGDSGEPPLRWMQDACRRRPQGGGKRPRGPLLRLAEPAENIRMAVLALVEP